ncbi:MAG TPA: hypothetical protein ENK18_20990 [Deltaproteobacteria bacterium]|nr:hypothetical protein [Deltaproteobacteria bacterium]
MPPVRLHPWNIEIGKIGAPQLPPVESLAQPPPEIAPGPHPSLPYENLAFEGGGVKGIAYVGALEVLEEVGLYPGHIRRVAGASSGSFLASMVAVGCSSEDLREMLAEHNLGAVMRDARFGMLSGIYNMLTVYGLNPGARLLRFLGDRLRERTGSEDVTFQQLLERCGRELCVPVTNITRMCTEYCHPKTTPDMPVRLAVGMSMSLPVLMAPYRLIRVLEETHETDLYTDGGLLCNYPIHAYDGWWLSLAPQDTYLSRLRPLSQMASHVHDLVRFQPSNPKTLGFTVFEQSEIDVSQRWTLPEGEAPKRPDTPLARARGEREAKLHDRSRMSQALGRAAERLMDAMAAVEISGDGLISREEAEGLFRGGRLSPRDASLLFGTTDVHAIFDELDHNGDGQISYAELVRFIDSTNVPLTAHLALARCEPKNVTSFISVMFQTVWAHMRRVTLHPEDRFRTVAIDTDYISTADFHMDPHDQAFLLETGRRATEAFLAHHHGLDPKR